HFMKHYLKFGLMILTSTVVMFLLMYANTYSLDHVTFSETRIYMAIVMGAAMGIVMLGFMLNMFTNRRLNIAILAGSAGLFVLSLWLVRSQAAINQVDYMKAMIPH